MIIIGKVRRRLTVDSVKISLSNWITGSFAGQKATTILSSDNWNARRQDGEGSYSQRFSQVMFRETCSMMPWGTTTPKITWKLMEFWVVRMDLSYWPKTDGGLKRFFINPRRFGSRIWSGIVTLNKFWVKITNLRQNKWGKNKMRSYFPSIGEWLYRHPETFDMTLFISTSMNSQMIMTFVTMIMKWMTMCREVY